MTAVVGPQSVSPAIDRPRASTADVIARLRGPLRLLAAVVAALVIWLIAT